MAFMAAKMPYMGIQYEPFEEVKDAVWEHHGAYFRNVLIYS